MYGTVARMRAKPGMEEQLIKQFHDFEAAHVQGTVACQYASGERVLAASMCDLQNGKIVREVTVQAWDE